jgi:hypothetical protein
MLGGYLAEINTEPEYLFVKQASNNSEGNI